MSKEDGPGRTGRSGRVLDLPSWPRSGPSSLLPFGLDLALGLLSGLVAHAGRYPHAGCRARPPAASGAPTPAPSRHRGPYAGPSRHRRPHGTGYTRHATVIGD